MEHTDWGYAEYMRRFAENDPFFFNRQQAETYDPNTRTGYNRVAFAEEKARQAEEEAHALRRRLAELESALAEREARGPGERRGWRRLLRT